MRSSYSDIEYANNKRLTGRERISCEIDANTPWLTLLTAAPPSIKNRDGKRDEELHQSKNGKNWCFDMKPDIVLRIAANQVAS